MVSLPTDRPSFPFRSLRLIWDQQIPRQRQPFKSNRSRKFSDCEAANNCLHYFGISRRHVPIHLFRIRNLGAKVNTQLFLPLRTTQSHGRNTSTGSCAFKKAEHATTNCEALNGQIAISNASQPIRRCIAGRIRDFCRNNTRRNEAQRARFR